MKIQRTSNTITQQSKNNINFKAIYPKDTSKYLKLEQLFVEMGSERNKPDQSIVKLLFSKKGRPCRLMIQGSLDADLMEKYDLLLLEKGISTSDRYNTQGGIFSNKKETKLIENYKKKIEKAESEKNLNEVINQRLLLFEELKQIVKKAKPISNKKLDSVEKQFDAELKNAKANIYKGLFS